MRRLAILIAGVGLVALGTSANAPTALAKGCIKGAIVGGVAGHVAGHHGVLGAVAGCAIGRHEANKHARENADAARATTAKSGLVDAPFM